jgi:hypothetical protein
MFAAIGAEHIIFRLVGDAGFTFAPVSAGKHFGRERITGDAGDTELAESRHIEPFVYG